MNLQELATEIMVAYLHKEGLAPYIENNLIYLGVADLACKFVEFYQQDLDDACVMSIAIETLHLPSSQERMYEVVVGTEKSIEDAVSSAICNWISGVLPPIREFFDPQGNSDLRTSAFGAVITETGEGIGWNVITGVPQVMGEHQEELLHQLKEQRPFNLIQNALSTYLAHEELAYWIKHFQTTEVSSIADEPLYWIKIFLARREDNTLTGDCWLNNYVWPEGLEALSNFNWPSRPGFLGFRQFIILEPDWNSTWDSEA